MIAFLPAWVVWGALRWMIDKTRPSWQLLMAVIGVTLGMLLFQYLVMFGDEGIVLKPFETFAIGENKSLLTFAFNVALSVLFPLGVITLYRPAWRDPWIQLTWGTFGIALIQGLLFSESGSRAGHHNFVWGSVITAWLLFVVSARWLWQHHLSMGRVLWRGRLLWSIFALQGGLGTLWMIAHYLPLAVLLN